MKTFNVQVQHAGEEFGFITCAANFFEAAEALLAVHPTATILYVEEL